MYTVNELLDRFVAERVPRLGSRSKKDYTRHIVVLREHFGIRRAMDLKPADIERFRDVPKGRIHRDRMISVLRSALSHAVKRGWLESNVCSRVERVRSVRQARQLTDEEFEGAKKLATLPVQLVMDLAVLTGQSQGSILRLRWSQVHRDRGVILFRNNRTRRKDRKIEVRITPKLQAVLDRCEKLSHKKEFVVCSKKGGAYTSEGFRTNFQRLMKEWELTGNDRFSFFDIQDKWKRDAARNSELRDLESLVAEYPQFSSAVRDEAAKMSVQYEFFYCLEQSIRRLISARMTEAEGDDWWNSGKIPAAIHNEVATRLQREIDSGMTQRSERMIDYTTFGELSTIITTNWSLFENTFTSQAAVRSVMKDLNLLRGPIAHCCPVSPDEVNRLQLTVKDWFRIQGTDA